MSLNQIIDQDPLQPLVVDETLNLKGSTLRLKKKITVTEGEFDNVDTVTINNNPYPPGGGFLPVPVANKVLITDGSSVVSWGSVGPHNLTGGATGEVLKTISPGVVDWDKIDTTGITPGAPLSILQTNLFGTGTQWSTLLTLPGYVQINSGNLTLLSGDIIANAGSLSTGFITTTTGTSNLSNVSLNGDLAFNAVSGSVGQVLKKTAVNDQAWSNLLVSDLSPGINRQVLQMNGATPTWVSSLTLPAAATISCSGGVQFTGAGTFFDCTAYARFLGNPLCARFDGQVTLNDTTSSFGDFTSNADFYNNGGLSLDGSFGNPYEVPSASGVSGTSPVWRPQNEYILCYNPNAYDVNSGAEFMVGGIIQQQVGTTFTFDDTTGLFTCVADGTYLFELQCVLDTMDAPSKLRISDGTNNWGLAPIIYLPGTVQKQSWSCSQTLPATNGQVWDFRFGGTGVCNTIPTDPTYGNPQSFLKITRIA